jgi:FkbM family methyltransferase
MNTQILKRGAKMFHRLVSKSKTFTKLYITFLTYFFHRLPDSKIKHQVLNSINSIEWQNVDLPAQTIRLGSQIQFKIIPHFHEFDLEAIINEDISYEKEVFKAIEDLVKEADAVIEIGANIGIYSLFFAALLDRDCNSSQVFVFEPSSEAYLRLLKNISINNFKNIQPFNIAVGDIVDVQDFFEPSGHLTNGSLDREFASIFSASLRTRKTFVVDGNLLINLVKNENNIFIKIDVEGAEFDVLKGLENFIRLKKPKLVIEVLQRYQDALNQLVFLKELGYSFYNITDSGLVQKDLFIGSEFRDYLLLPLE